MRNSLRGRRPRSLTATAASCTLLTAMTAVALPFASPFPSPAVAATAATDWTDWQTIPDQYQGGVEIHFRLVESKDAPGGTALVYQLRNHYAQKVTLRFQIEGEAGSDSGPRLIEQTAVLDAGSPKKAKEQKEQRVALSQLTRVLFGAITFEGTPPPATSNGSQADSSETQRLRGEIARAKMELKNAYDAQTAATRTFVTTRARVEANKAIMHDDTGQYYIMDAKDVYVDQTNADNAAQKVRDIRTRLDDLEAQLKQVQGLDAKETKLVRAARQYADAGDWAKAEKSYRSALLSDGVTSYQDTDKAALNANLAITLRHQNKYAEAETYFRKATELAPQVASYQSDLAGVLVSQSKSAEAETALREAIRLNPGNPDYHYDLGLALWDQNKFVESEASFREALRLSPDSALYHDSLGVALFSQDKTQDALKAFQEAVQREPGNATFKTHLQAAQDKLKS